MIFYILIEAKGFVIGTDDNLLMRFTNSFVLKGNFMEKHTLGYPQLSAVFLDTANKYKQDLMNEPIKWEKINNFIESIYLFSQVSGGISRYFLIYNIKLLANSDSFISSFSI